MAVTATHPIISAKFIVRAPVQWLILCFARLNECQLGRDTSLVWSGELLRGANNPGVKESPSLEKSRVRMCEKKGGSSGGLKSDEREVRREKEERKRVPWRYIDGPRINSFTLLVTYRVLCRTETRTYIYIA